MVVCENYPESQISKEHFVDIQWAIGQLVDKLHEEGFTPKPVDSNCAKGAAITVCHNEMTKHWMGTRVPTLVAWEGSRLKIVGLDALPTFKRVVEDAEWYLLWLHRLNQGLDTRHWRVYECKEKHNGVHPVLSIDAASITVLEGLS